MQDFGETLPLDINSDQKYLQYDLITDSFKLTTVNNFPETPNDNTGYLRKTTAGTGNWVKLINDAEYSYTKGIVLQNQGDIDVIQNQIIDINNEQVIQNDNISNLNQDIIDVNN